jgi:hypothetical protein
MSLGDKLTSQQLLKTEEKEKKALPIGQPPGKSKTELLLRYQHQDWVLEE